MPFLFTVRAQVRWLIPVHGSKGGRISAGLCSTSPNDGIFLLQAARDSVRPKRGRVHGSVEGQLEVFVIIAEGVEEKNDLDLIEIDRPYVGDLCMHSKNFIGAIIEG